MKTKIANNVNEFKLISRQPLRIISVNKLELGVRMFSRSLTYH